MHYTAAHTYTVVVSLFYATYVIAFTFFASFSFGDVNLHQKREGGGQPC